MDQNLLDEKVIYQSGGYRRVVRWLRGIHPGLGKITMGLTGLETVVEKDYVMPYKTFQVLPKSP